MPDTEVQRIEAALARLETAIPCNIDLGIIVKDAHDILDALAPWADAKSKHPAVCATIRDMREQGRAYYHAIEESFETAQSGFTLSDEAIKLCQFIMNEETTGEQLQGFIKGMREIAKKAHQSATKTSDDFRSIRKGIYQIMNRIPDQAKDIALAAKARRRRWFFLPLLVFMPRPSGSNDILAPRDYSDALRDLNDVVNGLVNISKSVDAFADWWLNMDTVLSLVEASTAQMKPSPREALRLRTDSLLGRWRTTHSDYKKYVIQIARLLDRQRSRDSSAWISSSV